MKIEPTGPVGTRPATRRERVGSARADDFSKHIHSDSSAAGATGANSPVSAVDALIALQEVPDSTAERANARAREHGRLLLDHLDEIRHGLLMGTISRATLEGLARALRARKSLPANPKLAEVLEEIELRAEVELAKLRHG